MKSYWHPPSERPQDDRAVWIIEGHPKGVYPQSFSVHAGVVEESPRDGTWHVSQGDESGRGWVSWYPEESSLAESNDSFKAWAYADELLLIPAFVLGGEEAK